MALGTPRMVTSVGPSDPRKRTGAKRVVSGARRARLSKMTKERWARVKAGRQKIKKAD